MGLPAAMKRYVPEANSLSVWKRWKSRNEILLSWSSKRLKVASMVKN